MVGIYIGYDKPRNLGRGATGGHLAAPIASDFLKLALADKPAIPFRVPAGIKLIRVDAKTGMRAGPGDGGKTILEAFKPGTAPPDNYSVIGVADADGRSLHATRRRPQHHALRHRRALLARLRFAAPAATSLCARLHLKIKWRPFAADQRAYARRSRTVG